MKTTETTLAALAALTLASGAQEGAGLGGDSPNSAAEVGVLPKQKEEMVKDYLLDGSERNPFARRNKAAAGGVEVDTESEEARIRAALESFSVSGLAKGGGGYSAQLGSIILEEGELIPRLIPGQVDDLRVTKVTPELVELTWVADEEAAKPRQVSLPVDLAARVGVVLPTAKPSSGAGATQQQLVYHTEPEKDTEQQP